MNLVVFLQNAWSPFFAGHTWPRASWLRALEKSRTGRRLEIMIDDFDLCEETTPEVAATPSGICKPNFDHINSILKRRKPEVVVACGKQAEECLVNLWSGPLLAVPHPAYRVVTNDLYRRARILLEQEGGFRDRLKLVPKCGDYGFLRWTEEIKLPNSPARILGIE